MPLAIGYNRNKQYSHHVYGDKTGSGDIFRIAGTIVILDLPSRRDTESFLLKVNLGSVYPYRGSTAMRIVKSLPEGDNSTLDSLLELGLRCFPSNSR